MAQTPELSDVLGDDRIAFYRSCLDALEEAGVECLIGGAYGLRYYTGIVRDTKDLDLFVRPEDVESALDALRHSGYKTEVTCPAWLGKCFHGAAFVDVIWRSGNGAAQVDARWFEYAEPMRLFDRSVKVTPIEEMIWSKAFTMERERFDLADIVHLIQARGPTIDWAHLIGRFGPHWRVLFSHVVLYQFAFPGERRSVPDDVIVELTSKLLTETMQPEDDARVCQGTLLSGSQYLIDTLFRGYEDARFLPHNNDMDDSDLDAWRQNLDKEQATRLKLAALIPPAVQPQGRPQQPAANG